ncbi:MAG TPA: hypothetical protein VGL22_16270 [Terracidiphilus sp.]
MSRIDPPPLATWMLEHCIPGQKNDALAGDLLEEFQCGRSNGWYWRQALAACVVGWVRYLGNRTSLIVFALLWSLLAPAWAAMIDRVQNHTAPWPLEVAEWVGLNLAFVWLGMLLFACLHRQLAHHASARKLALAFALAAAIFLPAYVATFVLANFFLWPGLGPHLRGVSPLREIADFRLWADALRLPYFITFLSSMWSVTPLMAAVPVAAVEWNSTGASPLTDTDSEPVYTDPYKIKRMLAFMVAAGLLNALIAAYLLCRLPEAHHPTVESVFFRAIAYVALAAVAGVVGTYLYWHNPASPFRAAPPLAFPLFAIVCTAGWVWVPAMVLFSEQLSALSAAVAVIAAFLLAGEMRRILLLTLPPEQPPVPLLSHRPMFAETLYEAPAEPEGYLLAVCVYAAGWAIADGANMTAAALLASGTCLFRMKTVFAPSRGVRKPSEYRRAALRLGFLILPAVLVTFWALLDGVAHRNRSEAFGTAQGAAKLPGSSAQTKKQDAPSTHIGSGFESIVLWPYPPKKEIVAPLQPAELLAPGTTQPLVIRFTGEYWYLQPPDLRPTQQAHRANGTPLDLHIASANSFPLMMQAHQYLRSQVRIARCREIRVQVESREPVPGAVVLAVWLKDSSGTSERALYLGQQPITEVGSLTASPAQQTLVFAIPPSAKMRIFNEIALEMLPDTDHQRVGPRVAIRQFELVPR